MTVRELAEKLSHYQYQDAEIDIGCSGNYGHCLYAHINSGDDNIFLCDYPENCEYYVEDFKENKKTSIDTVDRLSLEP